MPSAEDPVEPDYRFTLANERTFLAYERTAVGLVAAGLAVVHLLDEEWGYQVLSILLVGTGGIAAIGGYLRFRAADTAIRAGDPLPANPSVHLLAAAVLICLVFAAVSMVSALG